MLSMMAELSDDPHRYEYEPFAARWFARLIAVLLRGVRDPALAYDLATETLAAARLHWESAPLGDEAVGWLLRLGAGVLDAAVQRGGVPATERRRPRQPAVKVLSASEQREIAALAEAHIELPPCARDDADAFVRTAPAPHVLRALRLSGLVEAEPLSDRESSRHGS